MSFAIELNDRTDLINVVGYVVAGGVKRSVDATKNQRGDALKAARINAATVATTAEIEGMKAANEDRSRNGYAMAYSDSAFDAVAENLRKQVEEILGS